MARGTMCARWLIAVGFLSTGGAALRVASPALARPKGEGLQSISDAYQHAVKQHYLPMAFLQAGVLASSADVASQLMEHSMQATARPSLLDTLLERLHLVAAPVPAEPVILAHVLAMALVASTWSGLANAVWLRQLEAAFPGRAARAIAAKTLIHAVLLASIINSAYLVLVPLFTVVFAGGELPPVTDPSAYLAGWELDEFITLTKLEVCMFIPYNTLAFRFVPPRVRPLTHALVSATFNVAVSAVTLGFWDVWCERAVSTVLG